MNRAELGAGSGSCERGGASARIRRFAAMPETWAAGACVIQLGVSLWWIAINTRVPDVESSRHFLLAFRFYDEVSSGDLFGPFRGAFPPLTDLYPPVHHSIGIAASLLTGGPTVTGTLVLQNLVLLPLLAIATYGAGRAIAGRTAGAMAAVFMLAIPSIGPLFHTYQIDTTEMTIAAATLWLLLASHRFERRWISVAAGVAVAAGMLTKANFLPVWIGVVAVMILRGGRRNWKNVLIFGVTVCALAAPWYLDHLSDIRQQTQSSAPPPTTGDSTWSVGNFMVNFWSLAGVIVYLPLLAITVFGTAWSVGRFLRRRDSDDYTPELVTGAALVYLGATYVGVKEWRYVLTILPFVALLGTTWLPTLPRLPRRLVMLAISGLFVVNLLNVNFGAGPTLAWHVGGPAAWPKGTLGVTGDDGVVFTGGMSVGKADGMSRLPQLLRKAHNDGIERTWIYPPSGWPLRFELPGVNALAIAAGLRPLEADARRLGPRDIAVVTQVLRPGDPTPCTLIAGGVGVYFRRGPASTEALGRALSGSASAQRDTGSLYCPDRAVGYSK